MGICLHPLLLVFKEDRENICLRYSRVSLRLPQKQLRLLLWSMSLSTRKTSSSIKRRLHCLPPQFLSPFSLSFSIRDFQSIYIWKHLLKCCSKPKLWRRLNLKIFILSLEIHACILWNALVVENTLALLGRLEKLYIMHLLPLYAIGASLTLTNLQVNWICHWWQCYLAVWTLSNKH